MSESIRSIAVRLPRIEPYTRRLVRFARGLARPACAMLAAFMMMYAGAPFAAAYFAAALCAGESPLALCLGCAAGAIRSPISELPLIPAAACVLALAGEFAFSVSRVLKKTEPATRVSVTAGLSLLIPAMIAAGGDALDSLEALACASISAAAAPFLRALMISRRLRSGEARIGFLIIAAGMISGTYRLAPEAGMLTSAAALCILAYRCDAGEAARRQLARMRRRVRALGDAFGEMAAGCACESSLPAEQALILSMREKLCAACPDYAVCWAGAENRAARLMCRLIGDAISAADEDTGSRLLYADGELPPDILRACRRGRMIPDRLGLTLRDFADRRRSEIKRCATGRLLSVQLDQAQMILNDLAARPAARSLKNARYRADAGVCCQSGMPGEVSGDAHRIVTLDDGYLALMLSDGMGMGGSAAEESREALRLLTAFLRAGIARPLALETLNQQMLMRTGEDIFATVDLCVIDLYTGEAEFSKLAACRTLILRGREAIRVEGGRLPLGILEHVEPARTRLRLRAGDVILMGSDGVMDSGMAVEAAALSASGMEPGRIAERIVREAALCRRNGRADDLTCVCARLLRAGEAPLAAKAE